ncbi:MAG: class I SAM-dependent methyltransferase [Acidimicrobiales bacterium]
MSEARISGAGRGEAGSAELRATGDGLTQGGPAGSGGREVAGDGDQEFQRTYYDRHYAGRAAAVRDQHRHPLFRSFNDRTAARLFEALDPTAEKEFSPVRVLEIGCGEGLLGAAIERTGAARGLPVAYTGSDLSASALDIAREVVNGSLICGDASQVAAQMEPGTVDLVVAKNLLHHLDDPSGLLATLRPLLSSRGRVVAFEPRLGCPQFLFFNLLAARRERHYFAGQGRNRRAFTDAGYRVVSLTLFSWLPYELAFVIRPGLLRRLFSVADPKIIAKVSAVDDRLTKAASPLACYAVWTAAPSRLQARPAP